MVIQESPACAPSSDQELEQEPVVVDRHPPFPVVIGPIERVAAGPGAAGDAIESHCAPFTAKTANMPGYAWGRQADDHDGTAIAGTMPPVHPWQDSTVIPAERIPCYPGNRY